MPATSIIDLEHLDKYVLGDDGLRDEILSIFYDQAESLRDRFDVTLQDVEWKDVSHALKGASRGVGAWALGDLCEEAESLLGDAGDKLEKREQLLQNINEEINAALGAVVELRSAA